VGWLTAEGSSGGGWLTPPSMLVWGGGEIACVWLIGFVVRYSPPLLIPFLSPASFCCPVPRPTPPASRVPVPLPSCETPTRQFSPAVRWLRRWQWIAGGDAPDERGHLCTPPFPPVHRSHAPPPVVCGRLAGPTGPPPPRHRRPPIADPSPCPAPGLPAFMVVGSGSVRGAWTTLDPSRIPTTGVPATAPSPVCLPRPSASPR